MKQRETAQSKTTPSIQERLIDRETFQYVTTNPRKYGVVSTHNERQLAKAMDSLHMQQNKRRLAHKFTRSRFINGNLKKWMKLVLYLDMNSNRCSLTFLSQDNKYILTFLTIYGQYNWKAQNSNSYYDQVPRPRKSVMRKISKNIQLL